MSRSVVIMTPTHRMDSLLDSTVEIPRASPVTVVTTRESGTSRNLVLLQPVSLVRTSWIQIPRLWQSLRIRVPRMFVQVSLTYLFVVRNDVESMLLGKPTLFRRMSLRPERLKALPGKW